MAYAKAPLELKVGSAHNETLRLRARTRIFKGFQNIRAHF